MYLRTKRNNLQQLYDTAGKNVPKNKKEQFATTVRDIQLKINVSMDNRNNFQQVLATALSVSVYKFTEHCYFREPFQSQCSFTAFVKKTDIVSHKKKLPEG